MAVAGEGLDQGGMSLIMVTAVSCVVKAMILMGLGVYLVRRKHMDSVGIKAVNTLLFQVRIRTSHQRGDGESGSHLRPADNPCRSSSSPASCFLT